MNKKCVEKAVAECYSTWSKGYYDEYYGDRAPYPPVHRDILIDLLKQHGSRSVLDAGCGPASFLRDLQELKIERFGFDLTEEMVEEAQRVLAEQGVDKNNIWQGSVLDPGAFQSRNRKFDSAVCIGVIPHVEEAGDEVVSRNLYECLNPRGIAVLEARNKFFSLFTLNRYSHAFFENELIQRAKLEQKAGALKEKVSMFLDTVGAQFRTDQPPIRRGKESEPGYDEVLSRTHNPIQLKEIFEQTGFKNVELLFYHYHCMPPFIPEELREFFLEESIRMENPRDWRGLFMASAVLVKGMKE